ncbi:unnamed protein product [Rhizoctonia solani]|uniref:Uncharacterized protein n=1 Tax=Rhizoctonia solani TaxID=456999 RepID=A0A8H2WG43_9AGAM|nr:unnamed protein product [Rhizoctonia solani]
MGGIAPRETLPPLQYGAQSKKHEPAAEVKPKNKPRSTVGAVVAPKDKPQAEAKEDTPPKLEVNEVTSSPTDVFKNLLDMTHVPPGTEPAHFHTIAQTLMQNFELCVTSKSSVVTSYEFLEVEFYWYNQQSGHIDPFTHAAEEQRVSGNWYFHRAPRRVPPNSQSTAPVPSPKTNGFRGGTRKGLDLTFGIPANESTVAYGGILLRTLRNTQTKKVTCGPSLLVDEVLRSIGATELSTLVGTHWGGDTSAFVAEPGPNRMFLRPVDGKATAKLSKMYTSPRIGLELSRIQTLGEATASHPRVQYVTRPYRFFTHPDLMGSIRPQTFYGLLQAHESGQLTRAGIADVSGMKPSQVSTFFGYVEEGRKAGPGAVKEFVGEKGKGVGPSPARFLKMAGVVECILDDSGGERVQKKQKLGPTLSSMFANGSKDKPAAKD